MDGIYAERFEDAVFPREKKTRGGALWKNSQKRGGFTKDKKLKRGGNRTGGTRTERERLKWFPDRSENLSIPLMIILKQAPRTGKGDGYQRWGKGPVTRQGVTGRSFRYKEGRGKERKEPGGWRV